LTKREFERLVEGVLESLPADFRSRLDNVEVEVQARPSDEILDEMEVPEDETLFGLYLGTPLTDRHEGELPRLPDRILIFQEPIEEACSSRREIEQEVRRTVIHEVAHFFGIDEDRLRNLGWD
jgi:predicted Zn-dependent protease with MMP-like domain